jgi:hypothetical protein
VFGHAVVGQQGIEEGSKYTPLRGPSVKDQRGRHVLYYSQHLGEREIFSPRVLSIVMSFEGTMVLNAEL